MNLSNIFGTHSVFYFYGVEHLAINMYTYITEGMKNNEQVCISMAPHMYDRMMEIIHLTKDFDHTIVQRLIDAFRVGGESVLRETVTKVATEARESGYSGIRCIWQPAVVMPETSLIDWRCWEESLTAALVGTRCSILCLVDMMDLIAKPLRSEEERIRGTLQVHPYILYQMHLEEMASLRA